MEIKGENLVVVREHFFIQRLINIWNGMSGKVSKRRILE